MDETEKTNRIVEELHAKIVNLTREYNVTACMMMGALEIIKYNVIKQVEADSEEEE